MLRFSAMSKQHLRDCPRLRNALESGNRPEREDPDSPWSQAACTHARLHAPTAPPALSDKGWLPLTWHAWDPAGGSCLSFPRLPRSRPSPPISSCPLRPYPGAWASAGRGGGQLSGPLAPLPLPSGASGSLGPGASLAEWLMPSEAADRPFCWKGMRIDSLHTQSPTGAKFGSLPRLSGSSATPPTCGKGSRPWEGLGPRAQAGHPWASKRPTALEVSARQPSGRAPHC